jgi:two-component system, sensor histidine kinase
MQKTDAYNSKTFDFEVFKKSALPSKEQFYEVASNTSLLAIRPVWVSVSLRLLLAAILSISAPLYLVLIWLALSLAANYSIMRLSFEFSQMVLDHPKYMTEQMKLKVKTYKNVWLINGLIWGCASVLAQLWLGELPRILTYTVLTAAIYLFLTRNCANKKLMNQVSSLILGIPFAAALVRLVMSDYSSQAVFLFLGLTFYLALTGFMVFLIGGRLNKIFKQTCVSDYSNLQLIESLELSHEKLRVEQAALTAANSVIQQFYSAAAHDLRQPVYAMELYADMLHDDPSQMVRLLPKISQSCMSINAMFNELFDFQQKHLSDVKLEQTTVNIADTFKNLALHFEPIAAAKNLNISFKPLDGCVNTIPLYFIRILSNLIANAITYTQSGRILIAARKSGEFLSFEIWDTGAGIEKAAQDKIFMEFYKINTTGKKTSNLGLGLAIVKELVQRLEDAKIRVNSMVGHGSVFKLLLPIATYSAPQKLQPVESTMHYSL